MDTASVSKPVLEVWDLVTSFRVRGIWYPAILDISFSLYANETLALVGESGCGKSVTAFSIMRLLPKAGARIERGSILFEDENLLLKSEEEMRRLRGNRIAMIFQEPMTSLNPVLTIGKQVSEAIVYHRQMDWEAARAEAARLLDEVKIPSAANRLKDYPHQLSGGMRQRVMIAMALACQPKIILADEPTTALDVTIQAQVLWLLSELKKAHQTSMIYITHDLAVVARLADRVAVMYAGQIVEVAAVKDLFENPIHPYTEALFKAMPRLDQTSAGLKTIPGMVPTIDKMVKGCRFHNRCELKQTVCESSQPALLPIEGQPQRLVRCWVRN